MEEANDSLKRASKLGNNLEGIQIYFLSFSNWKSSPAQKDFQKKMKMDSWYALIIMIQLKNFKFG